MLYICGTPIGNLEDMTYRVVRVLSEVDLIAAEDTRQSVKLLNHFDIKTPLTSYYEHNKDVKGPQLIKLLQEGKDIALVTDAGMPGISDPGEDLIKLCYENDVPVTVVPGPTAVVTALVLSGLNSRSYIFEGFLPRNKKQRTEVLERLVDESRTTVFYEAPHHLVDTLESIYKTVGDRNIAVARELTKKHETVNRGTVGEVLEYFKKNEPKGEFVLVLEGKDKEKIKEDKIASFEEMTIEEHFNMYIEQGMSEKDAMKQDGQSSNCSLGGCYKQEIYQKYAAEKGEGIMRIAVTYENGQIFQHFGHTETFKIYDVEEGKVVHSEVVDTNGSGHGALAEVLNALNVDVLICGGIGGGAQTALAAAGIKFYGGVSGDADQAVEAFINETLDYNPDVRCSHHEHSHGEGHTCGEHGCGSHSCH